MYPNSKGKTQSVYANHKGNFKSLKELDRHRKICLGLPVEVTNNNEVPWGFDRDPENPKMCLPNEELLRLLLQVKRYLKQYSYKAMSIWLTKAGYPISDAGLFKLMQTRCPFPEIMLPIEERMKL